ncbi:FYVE zinc finger family protein [Tritrichomonas foetus]|uniref:FYVE zinc finger family protein n=1 Tax=Tritrichomonas foetus TaxID=1144522 RepID=A0A1J4KME9_9EUKA|nr:FYVE zinc finger family protein [Tritrichomonas foetus]|eukprot:OHT12481.1 FYVE zinc finger family protein [Tritrichomonas foetus]
MIIPNYSFPLCSTGICLKENEDSLPDSPPFTLYIQPKKFICAEIGINDPNETELIDALLIQPNCILPMIDFLCFERTFMKKINILIDLLVELIGSSYHTIPSVLLSPIRKLKHEHEIVLEKLDKILKIHSSVCIIEFIETLTHSICIFEAHKSYNFQYMRVEEHIIQLSIEYQNKNNHDERLNPLIQDFKFPIIWQQFSSELAEVLIQNCPPSFDPQLNNSLKDFIKTNESLTAAFESIRKLEQISKLFLREPFPIVVNGRLFIREGKAIKQCRKVLSDRVIFLFSDIFVYAQVLAGKYTTPRAYRNCYIRIEPQTQNRLPTINFYAPRKSFTLLFRNIHERDSWADSINSVIIESRNHMIIPSYKEAPIWIPDNTAMRCLSCNKQFSVIIRKHHCRNCGGILCKKCLTYHAYMYNISMNKPVKVCEKCYNILIEDNKKHNESKLKNQPCDNDANNMINFSPISASSSSSSSETSEEEENNNDASILGYP